MEFHDCLKTAKLSRIYRSLKVIKDLAEKFNHLFFFQVFATKLNARQFKKKLRSEKGIDSV
jgi:hypothetical protein